MKTYTFIKNIFKDIVSGGDGNAFKLKPNTDLCPPDASNTPVQMKCFTMTGISKVSGRIQCRKHGAFDASIHDKKIVRRYRHAPVVSPCLIHKGD